ncbi:hypothetical protein [Novosphingobium sp.]|uniref:hypothetical protein n=1 Tax=Novosphingobium sp. TaxID=1874826 RepID=UPI00333E1938
MSMFDSILGQLGGNLDVAGIAAKVGIDPAMAQTAISALAGAHSQPGDTVDTAAAQTGIDSGTLGQIAAQLGGEGGLGQLNEMIQSHPQAAGLLNMLDRDGDGNPINDVLGMAKGLFG